MPGVLAIRRYRTGPSPTPSPRPCPPHTPALEVSLRFISLSATHSLGCCALPAAVPFNFAIGGEIKPVNPCADASEPLYVAVYDLASPDVCSKTPHQHF